MYKCDGIHIVCIYVYMHTCIHARMQENTVENNKFQIQKRLSWDALRQVHGAGSTSVVLLLQIGTWDGTFPNKVELKIESNKYVFCGGGPKNIFDINLAHALASATRSSRVLDSKGVALAFVPFAFAFPFALAFGAGGFCSLGLCAAPAPPPVENSKKI